MPQITPCLWFDNQAEDAAKYYVSIFKNSRIRATSYYGEAGPGPKGSVLTVTFTLDGQEFMGLNGGPQFKFTEAVSFVVKCKTQKRIDKFWNKLSKGGEQGPCGWLKDKYGLSWQIVPSMLDKLMRSKDRKRVDRMMRALLQMKKLDIKALQDAFDGKIAPPRTGRAVAAKSSRPSRGGSTSSMESKGSTAGKGSAGPKSFPAPKSSAGSKSAAAPKSAVGPKSVPASKRPAASKSSAGPKISSSSASSKISAGPALSNTSAVPDGSSGESTSPE
jgi:predicted 3-demethylubiquinone-9 3-methyltransferase (glyoxalase superfamily)